MQLGNPSPITETHTGPAEYQADVGAALDADATLRLLHTCVEAMGLLQAKFAGLEVEAQIKLDAAAREITDLRDALGTARENIACTAQRLRDSENRLSRIEASAVDAARQHADDISTARAEAANARLRGETDAMAFDHLMSRLTRIEEGLGGRLSSANQEVVAREAENARLRVLAEEAQNRSAALQAKLRDVDSTIADQRSRISCLQSKLATATYAIRMEQMSRQFEPGADITDERDILDLQTTRAASMISAA